jgi:hypothetical protein
MARHADAPKRMCGFAGLVVWSVGEAPLAGVPGAFAQARVPDAHHNAVTQTKMIHARADMPSPPQESRSRCPSGRPTRPRSIRSESYLTDAGPLIGLSEESVVRVASIEPVAGPAARFVSNGRRGFRRSHKTVRACRI